MPQGARDGVQLLLMSGGPYPLRQAAVRGWIKAFPGSQGSPGNSAKMLAHLTPVAKATLDKRAFRSRLLLIMHALLLAHRTYTSCLKNKTTQHNENPWEVSEWLGRRKTRRQFGTSTGWRAVLVLTLPPMSSVTLESSF